MPQFTTDLADIHFNLFDLFEVQNRSHDYEASDLKEIINEFERFVAKDIYPTRGPSDTLGAQLTEKGVVVPESFHKANKAFYENGWFGLGLPEEIGGMPAPETIALTCSGLSTGASVAFTMYQGLSRAAMNVILKKGSAGQKALYVPKMMAGLWGGTMCMTEAGAGSDVGAVQSTATPLDDGSYGIKGVKIFISSGDSDLYENNIHLVLARTPDAPEGSKGLSLFIVPKIRINEAGLLGESNNVLCPKIEEKMGLHGSSTCELTFGQDGESRGFLLGAKYEGMANMFIMMNEARLMCGMQGESQANLCYLFTEKYARERSQFKTEIIRHPDIKRMLLKMRAEVRGMRTLNLYIANLMDLESEGQRELADEIALLTPISKGFCTEKGLEVAVDAVQIHGGYGYCKEYEVEQFVRDITVSKIYEGTNGIQALDFVMRKILKNKGVAFTSLMKKMALTLKSEGADVWPEELALLGKNMQQAEAILGQFAKWAQANKVDKVLEHCFDFMMFSGRLIIGWLSLQSALKARASLSARSGESEEQKKYLESKITDYKVFCRHTLVQNTAVSYGILKFNEGIENLEF